MEHSPKIVFAKTAKHFLKFDFVKSPHPTLTAPCIIQTYFIYIEQTYTVMLMKSNIVIMCVIPVYSVFCLYHIQNIHISYIYHIKSHNVAISKALQYIIWQQ